MDIPIKLKPYELEALNYLNIASPEVYQGKNSGFLWYLRKAACLKGKIEWEKIAAFKLEKIFSGEGFEEQALLVNHLTGDDQDYNIVADDISLAFSLKRPVQKAYLARNILKWGVMQEKAKEQMIFQDLEENLDNNYSSNDINAMRVKVISLILTASSDVLSEMIQKLEGRI